jgi:hypothetical protein
LARVIAATADDADRPTKLARQMSPQSFYLWPLKDEPTAGADLQGGPSQRVRPEVAGPMTSSAKPTRTSAR